jgi:hypothetical protein
MAPWEYIHVGSLQQLETRPSDNQPVRIRVMAPQDCVTPCMLKKVTGAAGKKLPRAFYCSDLGQGLKHLSSLHSQPFTHFFFINPLPSFQLCRHV